jgi:L-lactate utilization protein LutB
MIQGAQLSNSFILIMIPNEGNQPLTTTVPDTYYTY